MFKKGRDKGKERKQKIFILMLRKEEFRLTDKSLK
jgi:hypothetical protein